MRTVFNKCSLFKGDHGLEYGKENIDKPYYIVKSPVLERTRPGFLLDTVRSIEKDVCSPQALKKDKG